MVSAAGSRSRIRRSVDGGQCGAGKLASSAGEASADGGDRQMRTTPPRPTASTMAMRKAGSFGASAAWRGSGRACRPRRPASAVAWCRGGGRQRPPLPDDIAGHLGDGEAEKILQLDGDDDDGDAGGEAGDDRRRHVLASGRRAAATPAAIRITPAISVAQDQAVIAVRRDDAEDDDDEGAGRPADLHASSRRGPR